MRLLRCTQMQGAVAHAATPATCAGKRRREAFDFLGGAVIKKQLAEGVPRKRVGLLIAAGAPARQHSKLLGPDGAVVGEVTSGGFSPCLQKNIAMSAHLLMARRHVRRPG